MKITREIFFTKSGKRNRWVHLPIVNRFYQLSFVILLLALYGHTIEARSLKIPNEVEWKYFKGVVNSNVKWNHIDYDDTGWNYGSGDFGARNKTEIKFIELQESFHRLFLRHKFTVDDPSSITDFTLSIQSECGFVAYINGIKMIQSKVGVKKEIDVSGFTHELLTGTNILSIKCLHNNNESKIFVFKPSFKIIQKNDSS